MGCSATALKQRSFAVRGWYGEQCVCVCASRGMWCVVERIDLSELHTQVCKAVPAGAVLRMNDVRMLTTVNLVQH